MAKKHVPFSEVEQKFIHRIVEKRQKAAKKYPLVFGIIATIGVVVLLYGFNKIIDANQFLSSRPWLLVVIGLTILITSGAAYRKLN